MILMLRDGRDVACSIRERTGDFSLAVDRWVQDNAAGEAHWSDRRIHLIRYEHLVHAPEETLRTLMAFVDEPYDTSLLHYHRMPLRFYSNRLARPPSPTGRYHNQYRNWQINQPLFDGVGRWRAEMSADERRHFKDAAGCALIRYGYVSDDNW